MSHKIVAIVGMAGAGKTVVSRLFEEAGFCRVRFGDATDDELKKRRLPVTEANERAVREELRQVHGMAAYAVINMPRIDAALGHSDVVIDGLYSWEELLVLKDEYCDRYYTIAVWSSPSTRAKRLSVRGLRPLSRQEATSRDRAEIEKVSKAGPIAVADHMILNEGTIDELKANTSAIIKLIKEN